MRAKQEGSQTAIRVRSVARVSSGTSPETVRERLRALEETDTDEARTEIEFLQRLLRRLDDGILRAPDDA